MFSSSSFIPCILLKYLKVYFESFDQLFFVNLYLRAHGTWKGIFHHHRENTIETWKIIFHQVWVIHSIGLIKKHVYTLHISNMNHTNTHKRFPGLDHRTCWHLDNNSLTEVDSSRSLVAKMIISSVKIQCVHKHKTHNKSVKGILRCGIESLRCKYIKLQKKKKKEEIYIVYMPWLDIISSAVGDTL